MKGWLRRWGLTVWMWACCAGALVPVIDGAHISRWVSGAWISYTAAWVGIARLKDSTIRTQQSMIKTLRTHRDLLMQKEKAGLS